MSSISVDCRKNWRLIDQRIEQEQDVEKRQMLSQVKLHLQSETGGDLTTLMNTLTAEPIYHQWSLCHILAL